jgi:hypothetical protein
VFYRHFKTRNFKFIQNYNGLVSWFSVDYNFKKTLETFKLFFVSYVFTITFAANNNIKDK